MYRMSYAQFLGQANQEVNTNWITFVTTPDLGTNVVLQDGVTQTVFTSPTIPAGYWNFVLAYEIQSSPIIDNYSVTVSNNLTPASALPIWGVTNPNAQIQFFQSNTTTISLLTNTLSGMIWSDGTANSQISINVTITNGKGATGYWIAWDNATSYPSLSLFKIG